MQTVEVGVSDPEMAVIRFSVWDRPPSTSSEPRFICHACLPACALRTGYRNVSMRDRDGCKIAFCKMLWHVRTSHTHVPPAFKRSAAFADGDKVAAVAGKAFKSRAATAPPHVIAQHAPMPADANPPHAAPPSCAGDGTEYRVQGGGGGRSDPSGSSPAGRRRRNRAPSSSRAASPSQCTRATVEA